MLKSRIPQITLEIEYIVGEALEAGAEQIRESAEVRLAPHRLTGRLAEETHVHKEPEGVYVVAGDDQGDVFWGHFLEHGTSHSPPHPFLVPALEENRRDVVATVQGALRRL